MQAPPENEAESDAASLKARVLSLTRLTDELRKERDALAESDRRLRADAARHQLLFTSLPQLVWTCLPDGRCDHLGPQWGKYTGIPEGEQLDYVWLERVHPEDRARVSEQWASCVVSGTVFDTDFRIRRADGTYRWFKTRALPRFDRDGRIAQWVGTNTDVQDLREAEDGVRSMTATLEATVRERTAELAGATERLQVATFAAEIGIWEWNVEDDALTWDDRMHHLYGGERDTFSRSYGGWMSRVHPEDLAGVETAVWQALAGPEELDLRYRVQLPSGETRHVKVNATVLRDRKGTPIQMTGTSWDVTEEASLLAALLRSNADLDLFAHVASHDLKEPLRAISGCARILDERHSRRLDAEGKALIGHMLDGAARMKALIEGLLALSRVSAAEEAPRDTDANEALRLAEYNLKSRIEEASATLVAGPLPRVHGNPVQLLQVLQNLLGNALKYRSDEPPRIEVAGEATGPLVCFSVGDNGVGIEKAHAERAFEPFQRLHGDKYPGTGVGLTICRKIVERHGGRIWLEAPEGGGTIVRFTWPGAKGPGGATP